MIKKLLTAILLVIPLLVHPFAMPTANASPEIFTTLEGKWRGKGLVKAGPNSKNESIRCKMSNKSASDERRLKLSGNCAVSGFVFSLRGWIQQNGSKNSYSASMFQSLANLKQSVFSGKRSGRKLNFTFKARDSISKQNITATIQVSNISTSGFNIVVSSTDPKSGRRFSVGTIKFSKR